MRGGAILACKSLPADGAAGLGGLLPAIHETFLDLLQSAHIERAGCSAVVLGFPGIVSARQKRVLATNAKFDDAVNLDLEGWFKKAFGLPFLIENDARLALLGEYGFGAAQGVQDAVMVTLGSGIGGAAMLNGRLLESRHGLAGTIGGHLPVVLNGELCSCGNRGCAETEGSTEFLPQVYARHAGAGGGMLSAGLLLVLPKSLRPSRPATKRRPNVLNTAFACGRR